MFNRLKTLYDEGRIDKKMLDQAVDKGWITEAEAREIMGV